jgi:hypothetical protein
MMRFLLIGKLGVVVAVGQAVERRRAAEQARRIQQIAERPMALTGV